MSALELQTTSFGLLALVGAAFVVASLIFARKKAREANLMIQEAKKKATEIVKEASLFDEKAKKDFSENLGKLMEKTQRTVSGEIAKEVEKQLLVFQKMFGEEMKTARENFSLKIASEGESLQKEISNFKKDYQREAQEKIYARVKMVTKEAIGKSISESEHRKLVEASFKEAKEKGVI